MGPGQDAIALSLVVLSALLVVLTVRGARAFVQSRASANLAWSSGLGLASVAMGVETAAYLGPVSDVLLRTYVFTSAAIVGVLSLGVIRLFRRTGVRRAYAAYMGATMSLVGLLSFLTPLPSGMVSGGIISGNPSPLLLETSTLVTGPATIVLLTASAMTLRRSWRWQTLLLIGGALILGAGGTLYIASFPVALYYAEFVGIVLLFFGIISLPHGAATPARSGQPTGAS